MSLKKLYGRACKYIESVDRYAILRGALLFFVFITAMTYGVLVMSFRQNKQEALRTLSESAAQSAAKLTASIRVGADRVCAAADMLARFGEKPDERALSLLRTNKNDSLFSIFAVRLPDGTSLLCDGRIISNVDWTEETAAFGSESPVTVSRRSVSALDGKNIFRIFAPINADAKNAGETRVYGVVETEKLSRSFHSSGFGGQSALLLFESNSGNILMNTADWLDFGGSFMGGKLKYAKGFSGEELYRDFIAGKNGYTVIEDDSGTLVCAYLPVGISDWYIMQLVPEKTLYSEAMKNRYALFASFAFAVIGMILFVLWTNGRVARLKKNDESSKYQAEMRNRILASALAETSTRVFLYYRQSDELTVLKSDSAVNASSRRISDGLKHICEYEGLSGDDARKLKNSLALTGNGNTVKFTLCSRRTGKNAFLRYTLSGAKDENGDGSVIIGTARDITEDETERRRQIDLERFRSSVVTYKTTGMEILLERNRWRFVWNNEAYFIKAGLGNEMRANYDSDLERFVIPAIHPSDREGFSSAVNRLNLLEAFRKGLSEKSLEYRILVPNRTGESYEYRVLEIHLLRDKTTDEAKANMYIRNLENVDLERFSNEHIGDEARGVLAAVEQTLCADFPYIGYAEPQNDVYVRIKRGGVSEKELFRKSYAEFVQNYAAEQIASGYRAEFESFAAADSIVKRLCESGKCSFKYTDASGNPAELCFEAGADVYAGGSKVCAVIYKKPRTDK